MADGAFIAYGHQQYRGVPPSGRLAVITGSPQHHFALMQTARIADDMTAQLKALGIDAPGLALNIVSVRRP